MANRREPAAAQLGRTNAGKRIGYRLLNLDGSLFAAWTVAEETSIPGYYIAVIEAPESGGHIVWGTAEQDIARATIDPVQVVVSDAQIRKLSALNEFMTTVDEALGRMT